MHRCGNHVSLKRGRTILSVLSRNQIYGGHYDGITRAISERRRTRRHLGLIALGPLGGFALVWVGFIAAGCFFAAGGDTKALSKTIVGMIYGAIVAWIALLIIAKVPIPALGTVWPAIVVGVTVFFLVIVASTDLLSCVPANVYGYAALVGYTLSAGKLDALTAADNSNPLFLIVVSAILGAVLGYLMGQLSGVLKSSIARRSA